MIQIHRKLSLPVAGQLVAAWGWQFADLREVSSGTEFSKALPDSFRSALTMFTDKLLVVITDFFELLLPEGDFQNAAFDTINPKG
ncbi:MAG: hypothetical protein ACLFVO_28255 [Chloroflexaceae bacterium]